MKILAINGSGRRKGNTFKILAVLEEKLADIAASHNEIMDFEILNLHDYTINHCLGCRACMDKGEDYCPLNDDVPILKTKMHEANGIIFASPVFVGDVSSIMKALIDRLAYMCHRQELVDKCATIIASVHSMGINHTLQTMGAAVFSWGLYLTGKAGFRIHLDDTVEDVDRKYHARLQVLARNLFFAIKQKKFLVPSLLSLVVFRIQQKYRSNLTNNIDSQYWIAKGWADLHTSYYLTHHASTTKVKLATLGFKIIDALFVKG